MNPFRILNSRHHRIEEMLRVDTGRKKQRETVRQAILDSSHNVYIYGTRGSGKTFFQKTQAHYFGQLDKNVLPIYVPSDINLRNPEFDISDFVLHILNTIFLESWSILFKRPRSDLLRLSALNEHSILDDLNPRQQQFVRLYSILHAKQINTFHHRASSYGVSAGAKAENRREEGQTLSREQLLPSETLVIAGELAELISLSGFSRVIVHLDEIELMSSSQRESLLTVCFGTFNPIGVQFVVTGVPMDKDEGEYLLSTVESAIEMEGLSTSDDLGEMIFKYAQNSIFSFEDESVAVLYEFFQGHPRTSLSACGLAVTNVGESNVPVSPSEMTKACLEVQRKIADYELSLKMSVAHS